VELPRDEFWLPISIKSYIDWADHVVIVDGTITKDTHNACATDWLSHRFTSEQSNKIDIIESPYPHDDKGADGIMRNKYLSHIKKHYENDLAIVVDSDEVLSDNAEEQINKIIELIKEHDGDIFNPRMNHFIGDFSHVDSTIDQHCCPGRIFKISTDLVYPEVEHNFLESTEERKFKVLQPTTQPVLYYHYAYVKGKEDILKKYNNHMEKSNIHNPEFLKWWKNAHLMGTFPVKDFLGQHPKPIKEVFKLE